MANKRTLKHAINGISEELIAECIAASLYGSKNESENAEAILKSILHMQANYISRVSHPEPGMSAHAYFKDLRNKFSEEVGEIVDNIFAL